MNNIKLINFLIVIGIFFFMSISVAQDEGKGSISFISPSEGDIYFPGDEIKIEIKAEGQSFKDILFFSEFVSLEDEIKNITVDDTFKNTFIIPDDTDVYGKTFFKLLANGVEDNGLYSNSVHFYINTKAKLIEVYPPEFSQLYVKVGDFVTPFLTIEGKFDDGVTRKLDVEYSIDNLEVVAIEEIGKLKELKAIKEGTTIVNIKYGSEHFMLVVNVIEDYNDIDKLYDKYNDIFKINVLNNNLYEKLKGKILLKVEDSGKAFYVNPKVHELIYLGKPNDAFNIMREQGLGISNKNLERIEIGLCKMTGIDTDNDGLSDLLEDSIGTNKNIQDTDNDGFNDLNEILNKYNPTGEGHQIFGNNYAIGQKGRIFLQVEGNGEAWYVNPVDSKRYFLGRPNDAFNVMRELGLGISNNNFNNMFTEND